MIELLGDVLKSQQTGGIRDGRIALLWEETVTPEIAKQTEAVKVRNRVLYIKTKSPVWAQELNLLKIELMERINQRAGFSAVRDIRFKAGG